MPPYFFRVVCTATLTVSTVGAAIGAARWFGPDALVHTLAPLWHAPLLAGGAAPITVYSLVQGTSYAGREPVSLAWLPAEGWTAALFMATVCAVLGAAPTTPGGDANVMFAAPFILITGFFFVDRVRRVQRGLVRRG
jgi:hypothetical protein